MSENWENNSFFMAGDYITLKSQNNLIIHKITRVEPDAVWFFDYDTNKEVWIENADVVFKGNI